MFDGLFQSETDRALSLEAETPRQRPKKAPGFFTGMGTALVEGPIQGALESGRVITNVLAEYGKAAAFREGAPKDESIDRMFTTEDPNAKELGRLAKKYDPDPETSSTAAQIVHGFGKFATKVVGAVATAGPAAPLVVGVDEGVSEGLRLADKGVDAGTAAMAGAVRGAATAAAVALPVAGRTILQTVGLAAAGGPGAFIAEQATIREILRRADYEAQARAYDPFDVLGLVVSTAAPLTFGAAAHVMRARRGAAPAPAPAAPSAAVPDEVVDAARVELLNQHDAALVRGEGPEAVQVHAQGRAAAAAKIERGEPPIDARPAPEPTIPRAPRLDPEQTAVESRFADQVQRDLDGMLARYDALPEARGGKVINTDIARELSPDFVADRARHSASVHEPASWLMEQKYLRAIEAPRPDGENVVTFLAGGGGSGKSAAFEVLKGMVDASKVVVDTTLSKMDTATRKLEAALAAGNNVSVVMVLRDPVDAIANGVVQRAIRTGRTVPLDALVQAHEGANATVQALMARYAGDERVQFHVVDNRGGPGEAKLAGPEVLREVDYNGLEQKALETLKADYEAGRIPEAIFRAVAGRAAERLEGAKSLDRGEGGRGAERDGQEGTGRGSQQGARPQEVTADPARLEAPEPPAAVRGAVEQDTNVRAALQAIEARGDFEIELPDGARMSARQAMDEAAAAVKQAETDSKAFSAAIECALGEGA